MALIDIDVYHDHVSEVTDDPAKDVSSGEWNHHHKLNEGSITLAMLSAAAQAGAARTTAEYTTASIANGVEETGTITMTKGYRLLHIETSRAARVRMYVSAAQRTADATRAIGADPTGDHGVLLDFVTTVDDLSWDLSPVVDGFCASSAIPIAITNKGSTGAVVLTLTYQPTEV